jgi:anti-sigma B factor antagonist
MDVAASGKGERAMTARVTPPAAAAVAVVPVAGNLDIATVPALETTVAEALATASGVVLDLSGVDLCDSTGLGALVRIYRRARAGGKTFALRDPRHQIAEVLAMTGINKVIPVVSIQD